MKNIVVVEISGGVMVGAFSNNPDIKLVFVDWDENRESGEGCWTQGANPIQELTEETKKALKDNQISLED